MKPGATRVVLDATELAMLLDGIETSAVNRCPGVIGAAAGSGLRAMFRVVCE